MATEIVIETATGEVVIPSNSTSASHARNVLVTPQNGVVAGNVQQALEDLAAGVGDGPGGGAPTNAAYRTQSPNGTPSNERVLTQGTGITLTENAIAGTMTVSLGSHTHTADAITSGTLPSAVAYPTAEGTGFSNAVEARLLVELPTAGGVLDIAQESTLLDLGNDIDGIDTRVTALENAPDGVDLAGFADGALLKVDASSGSGDETLAEAVAGTDYIAPSDITRLRAVFPEADLPASAGTTTGYWKWTYADGSGSWSVVETAVEAPSFINGGDAFADSPE